MLQQVLEEANRLERDVAGMGLLRQWIQSKVPPPLLHAHHPWVCDLTPPIYQSLGSLVLSPNYKSPFPPAWRLLMVLCGKSRILGKCDLSPPESSILNKNCAFLGKIWGTQRKNQLTHFVTRNKRSSPTTAAGWYSLLRLSTPIKVRPPIKARSANKDGVKKNSGIFILGSK